MKKFNALLVSGVFAMFIFSCSGSGTSEQEGTEEDTTSTEETAAAAKVSFNSLSDGDTVVSPFVVEMGVEGMEIDPAGEVKEGMGHHHLIINGSYIESGIVIPTDSVHIHYGKGQTSDTLDLRPGNYTLTLQFADGFHQSFGEPLSSTINVVVKENNQ